MKPILVDVARLIGDQGGVLDVEAELEVESLVVASTEYRPERPATAALTLFNAGSGIVANGTVTADLKVPCSRCLEDFDLHLEAPVNGLFLDRDAATEVGDDEEWEPLEGEEIDLAPLLLSSLSVELPFAPVHDADCKGICATCGSDLNVVDCQCDTDEAPPGPFDALKGLLDESE